VAVSVHSRPSPVVSVGVKKSDSDRSFRHLFLGKPAPKLIDCRREQPWDVGHGTIGRSSNHGSGMFKKARYLRGGSGRDALRVAVTFPIVVDPQMNRPALLGGGSVMSPSH